MDVPRLVYPLGLTLMALVGACGFGADPVQMSDRRNVAVSPVDEPAGADGGSTLAASPSSSAGTSAPDAAAPGTGAAPDASVGPTAFTDAPAFAPMTGPSARKSAHNFAGNTPRQNPAGKDCGGCHTFFAGGTVFADAARSMPAVGAEVRVRDAAGNAVSAWTDADGNFFIRTSGAVTFPALVGVRKDAVTAAMAGSISDGRCASSSCHVAGKQDAIHLP